MVSNNNKENNLDKFCHSIGQNWYHVVLVTYKRRRVFQWKITNTIANEAIEYVCNKHDISIFTKEVMNEHVHLFVNCPPKYSINKLIQILKGGTSYRIRKKFPSLKKYDRLWSRGVMFRSLGSVSAEIVERYIDSSNIWEASD